MEAQAMISLIKLFWPDTSDRKQLSFSTSADLHLLEHHWQELCLY
jgi:hypothetical protein